MSNCLQLAAIGNDDLLVGLARLSSVRLNLLHNVHALCEGKSLEKQVNNYLKNDITSDRATDDVLSVEPRGLDGADEELRAVGVGTSIGHRHNAGASVLQGKVLILELVAVDGLATSSIVVGEVTSLEL